MNPGVLTARTEVGATPLIEGYEALRRQVLDREANRGWGLSLFLNRGMADWASAWAGCTAQPEGRIPDEGVRPSSNPRASLLPQRREELVEVLSAMVWALQRGR